MAEVETWKSAIAGTIGILKLDRLGALKEEVVRPGGTVTLTPDERIMNQDRAASTDSDVFKNGFLTPVRLIDATEDKADIDANPNLMSDEDLHATLKLHWKQLPAKLEAITNKITLGRLLAIANEDDATVKTVAAIQTRLDELDKDFHEIQQEKAKRADQDDRERFRAVTPS